MNKTKIGFSLLVIALIGGGIALSTSLVSCGKTRWYPSNAIDLDQLEVGTNYKNSTLYFNLNGLEETFKESNTSISFIFGEPHEDESTTDCFILNITMNGEAPEIWFNVWSDQGFWGQMITNGWAWDEFFTGKLKIDFEAYQYEYYCFKECIDNWGSTNGLLSDFVKIAVKNNAFPSLSDIHIGTDISSKTLVFPTSKNFLSDSIYSEMDANGHGVTLYFENSYAIDLNLSSIHSDPTNFEYTLWFWDWYEYEWIYVDYFYSYSDYLESGETSGWKYQYYSLVNNGWILNQLLGDDSVLLSLSYFPFNSTLVA